MLHATCNSVGHFQFSVATWHNWFWSIFVDISSIEIRIERKAEGVEALMWKLTCSHGKTLPGDSLIITHIGANMKRKCCEAHLKLHWWLISWSAGNQLHPCGLLQSLQPQQRRRGRPTRALFGIRISWSGSVQIPPTEARDQACFARSNVAGNRVVSSSKKRFFFCPSLQGWRRRRVVREGITALSIPFWRWGGWRWSFLMIRGGAVRSQAPPTRVCQSEN